MTYQFDIEHAKKHGVGEAVVIYNLVFWIAKNKASGKHSHQGRTWTYNSVKSWAVLFPFWTERQIRRLLVSLVDQGVLVTGNFNETAYDRTLWYAFSNESIFLNGLFDLTKQENQNDHKVEPIPDNKPDNKPDQETANKPKGENSASGELFEEPGEITTFPAEQKNGDEKPINSSRETRTKETQGTPGKSRWDSPLFSEISEVIETLNQETGSKFRSDARETQRSVSARLKDYQSEDIKATVRYMTRKWKGTDMEQYLTPDTLFRPSKFEKYYQEAMKHRPKDGEKVCRYCGHVNDPGAFQCSECLERIEVRP